jgi:peptidoglycan/xylan/chitin deacetylase (PgdA/CDA1 family)|tara:strand:+ start:246 stop:938 length:693 start_codon:yes stop_codon:yes gene_type:complete
MISNQVIGSKKSGLRVSEEMFEKHLRYFVKNNWKFIKMSDLNKYADDEKVVAITFDDGYLDNYKTAFPLLKKYNACATLFLVIDRHDNDWSVKKNSKHNTGILAKEEKLSDMQIQEMIDSNIFELGGHTITHPFLPNLTKDEKENEMISCKNILEEKFDTKITSFAYPFGIYSEEDINIIRNSSFESAVTTNEGVASMDSIYELKRIKASGKDNFYAFKLRLLKGFRGFI